MYFAIQRRTAPIVPIVPLLDILAILLIFFMLTTTFKERREVLHINIPKATHLPTTTTAEQRITLEVSESGEMRLADAPIDIRGLAGALESMKKQLPNAKVELKPDNRIPLQLLLEVWEALERTGFPVQEVPVRVQVQIQ